jgi:hypothetical protein
MSLSHSQKIKILWSVVLFAVVVAALAPHFPQPLDYHDFADKREIFGIPNFWDVISNLPFLLIGIFGGGVVSMGSFSGGIADLRTAYLLFFIGTACVGIGSGFYHLNPSNETLFWDRLPMTSAFAAFFCIVVGEYISVSFGKRLLWPFLFVGACSVMYWSYTESLGRGDLRPYALVQFLPIVLTFLILVMYRSPFGNSRYLWAISGTYAMAKIAEVLDGLLFEYLTVLSGHSLKHLIASAGGLILIFALLRREPVSVDT